MGAIIDAGYFKPKKTLLEGSSLEGGKNIVYIVECSNGEIEGLENSFYEQASNKTFHVLKPEEGKKSTLNSADINKIIKVDLTPKQTELGTLKYALENVSDISGVAVVIDDLNGVKLPSVIREKLDLFIPEEYKRLAEEKNLPIKLISEGQARNRGWRILDNDTRKSSGAESQYEEKGYFYGNAKVASQKNPAITCDCGDFVFCNGFVAFLDDRGDFDRPNMPEVYCDRMPPYIPLKRADGSPSCAAFCMGRTDLALKAFGNEQLDNLTVVSIYDEKDDPGIRIKNLQGGVFEAYFLKVDDKPLEAARKIIILKSGRVSEDDRFTYSDVRNVRVEYGDLLGIVGGEIAPSADKVSLGVVKGREI